MKNRHNRKDPMFTTLISAATVAFASMGGQVVDAPAAPLPLHACQFEDGNPDGQACTWIDPDTGRGFFVDSANYR